MSLSEATNAPKTLNINGKEYKVTGLPISDLGILERWVQDELENRAIQRAEKTTDSEIKAQIIDNGTKAAREFSILNQINTWINNIAFLIELVWLSLRIEHKDITKDEVKGLLTDYKTLERIVEPIINLSGLGVEQEKKRTMDDV